MTLDEANQTRYFRKEKRRRNGAWIPVTGDTLPDRELSIHCTFWEDYDRRYLCTCYQAYNNRKQFYQYFSSGCWTKTMKFLTSFHCEFVLIRHLYNKEINVCELNLNRQRAVRSLSMLANELTSISLYHDSLKNYGREERYFSKL